MIHYGCRRTWAFLFVRTSVLFCVNARPSTSRTDRRIAPICFSDRCIMESIIEKFRRLNRKLYEQPSADDARRAVFESAKKPSSTICEICGTDVSKIKTEVWHKGTRHNKLIAHHWRGYGHPLDVWWVCYSCNRRLSGHDGKMTKQQAIEFIKNRFSL